MKNNLFKAVLCCCIVLGLVGCGRKSDVSSDKDQKEKFMLGLVLDDGRHVSFSYDVPYFDDTSLFDALADKKITIDDFLLKLDYLDTLKDGGSKIYKYDKEKSEFGSDEFYVISCKSLDGINDIFISRSRDALMDKCSKKIGDLDGVSMVIKNGTLTSVGATVVITDTSDRKNIYGDSYFLERLNNGEWTKLKPKNPMFFNAIGRYVDDEIHTLEFEISWEYHYGKLKSGKYRIVKDTSEEGEGTTHYITVEFSIE